MAFKIAAKPTFTRDVALTTPDGQKGKITFTFRYVKPTEFEAFLEKAKTQTMRNVLADVIAGWDGVTDADGVDMPYSVSALDALLAEYFVADVIFREFVAGLRGTAGEPGARAKN